MILGMVRDKLGRIRLEFHGQNGLLEIELIADTGFDRELRAAETSGFLVESCEILAIAGNCPL